MSTEVILDIPVQQTSHGEMSQPPCALPGCLTHGNLDVINGSFFSVCGNLLLQQETTNTDLLTWELLRERCGMW